MGAATQQATAPTAAGAARTAPVGRRPLRAAVRARDGIGVEGLAGAVTPATTHSASAVLDEATAPRWRPKATTAMTVAVAGSIPDAAPGLAAIPDADADATTLPRVLVPTSSSAR